MGVIERTEEIFIGTRRGVVKCRIVSGLSDEQRWNVELVEHIVGTPWELVPGRVSQHVPVAIIDEGDAIEEDLEHHQSQQQCQDEEDADKEFQRTTPHGMHASRKAIAKYGQTVGCPGCDAIGRRGHLPGKVGYNHNSTCRKRIMKEMADDLEYRQLMQKHSGGKDAGEMDMISEEQRQSGMTHVRRAIAAIEMRQRNEALGSCMNITMMKMFLNNMDVAEVYSPPRVAAMARKMGLRAGWSLDLTTCDTDGKAWGFNSKEMRNRAARKLLRDKPMVLVGSPMCSPFGVMNNANFSRMDPKVVNNYMAYGRQHLKFCATRYKLQQDNGRYFLHEHPQSASSWKETCIKQLLKNEGVEPVVADQCCYGSSSPARDTREWKNEEGTRVPGWHVPGRMQRCARTTQGGSCRTVLACKYKSEQR